MTSELLRQLYSLTLASSLGLLTVLTLRRVIRRLFGANAAYSLWLLLPAVMLTVLLPHLHDRVSTTAIASLIEATSPVIDTPDSPVDMLGPAKSVSINLPLWIVNVWGAGGALFVLYLVGLQRAYLMSLGTLSGLHRVLRAERSVGSPAIVGMFRPKVILPPDFRSRYTSQERSLVLSHERTHLLRGDAGWNALAALMRCTFWFNPLIHLASRRFRLDQEIACDAAVLGAHPGLRLPYATAMLKAHLSGGALPIGCNWRPVDDLKERLRMLRRRMPNRRRRILGAALTALMTAAAFFTAWAAEPAAEGTMTASKSLSVGGQSEVTWIAGLAGWISSPNPTAGQPVIIAIRGGRIGLSTRGSLKLNSDTTRYGPQTSAGKGVVEDTILEGHIRVEFPGLRDGLERQNSIILETNRAAFHEESDGTSVVRFDEGRIQTTAPPTSIFNPPASQTPSEPWTPNMVSVRLYNADISQAAAAVQIATHRTIIVDPRVHARLIMLSSTPVTPEAFYQAFLDVLQTRGFVAMSVGPTGNVIRILPKE